MDGIASLGHLRRRVADVQLLLGRSFHPLGRFGPGMQAPRIPLGLTSVSRLWQRWVGSGLCPSLLMEPVGGDHRRVDLEYEPAASVVCNILGAEPVVDASELGKFRRDHQRAGIRIQQARHRPGAGDSRGCGHAGPPPPPDPGDDCMGRKISKTTGFIANPADPGDPPGRCGIDLVDVKRVKRIL